MLGWMTHKLELRLLGDVSITSDRQMIILMANRWGKVGTVTDFIFLGSKITVDGDCHHEIKRHFSLEEKL